MKETKVYVDELPKSCVGCKYFAEHRRQCNLELCIEWNEVKFKFNDCPLIDIKTHDRELDRQKAMWNELKEWVEENKYKQLDDRYIEQLVDVVNVKSLLDKMQELEGEDE